MSAVLLQNGEVYTPGYMGRKDILVTGSVIENIFDPREIFEQNLTRILTDVCVLDVSNCLIVPGFIDSHVHFEGAGGEGGYRFRTTPPVLSDFVRAGTTSAVGLLGTDCTGRTLESLLAGARGFGEEGLSTWIYTGGYRLPGPTLTGSIVRDICLIDKVIGLKFAVAEMNGGPCPSPETLRQAVADARRGGILSGKAGLVHVHVGAGKDAYRPLLDVIEHTDLPISQFLPTHVARLESMMEPSLHFGYLGGNLDITAFGEPTSPSAPNDRPAEASIAYLLEKGIQPGQITLSSDGNGSLPRFDAKGHFLGMCRSPLDSMMRCFRKLVAGKIATTEQALAMCTSNVAHRLSLNRKGHIAPGSDADILVLNGADLSLRHVMAGGRILMKDGQLLAKGTFEE